MVPCVLGILVTEYLLSRDIVPRVVANARQDVVDCAYIAEQVIVGHGVVLSILLRLRGVHEQQMLLMHANDKDNVAHVNCMRHVKEGLSIVCGLWQPDGRHWKLLAVRYLLVIAVGAHAACLRPCGVMFDSR